MSVSHLQFQSKASRPKNGIALFFDLEGFSRFFNQPDVNEYVTKFLNHVFGAVDVCIYGGSAYWDKNQKEYSPLSLSPIHVKFIGDGALYIWTPKKSGDEFAAAFINTLLNRLFNLKLWFSVVLERCAEDVPVVDLPARIRFGIARGTIFELQHHGRAQKEFIGFCLNLANRLQTYCRSLGFIASARIGMSHVEMEKHGYRKVIAKQIVGFPREIVIVDSQEFDNLEEDERSELFEPVVSNASENSNA